MAKKLVKTNYNNLTSFEAAAVLVAIVGLLLMGIEIYISLPSHQRAQVADAAQVLDLHQQFASMAGQVSVTVQFTFGTMQTFYEEFDLAFAQTFSFPDEVGTPVLKFASAFENYSASVSQGYASNNTHQTNAGEVLGAILISNKTQGAATIVERNYNKKQYYYHAPSMVQKITK